MRLVGRNLGMGAGRAGLKTGRACAIVQISVNNRNGGIEKDTVHHDALE